MFDDIKVKAVANGMQLSDHIAKAKKIAAVDLDEKIGGFPLHIFPKLLQAVITSWHDGFGFPVDWYGVGVMSAAATVAGNAYGCEWQNNWRQIPGFYMAIVGHSGAGKTHVQRHVTAPIVDIEKAYIEHNAEKMEIWQQEEMERQATKVKEPDAKKPEAKRIIVKQFTLETFQSILSHNPRGCLVNVPELAGWMNSMNQYRRGNDEQVWLEIYDHETIVKDTKEGTIRIPNACVNILGGVQPKISTIFSANGRDSNGALNRILFAYPDDLDKPEPKRITTEADTFQKYDQIIKRIHQLPYSMQEQLNEFLPKMIDTIYFKMDDEAAERYFQFRIENTKKYNAVDDDRLKSFYGKNEATVMRFATILKLFNLVCSDSYKDNLQIDDLMNETISKKEIEDSIILNGYFMKTSKKMLENLDNEAKRSMSKKHYKMYQALPEEGFTKTEGVSILRNAFEIGERTAYDFFKKNSTFFKDRNNVFYKTC